MAGAALERSSRSLGALAKVAPSFLGRLPEPSEIAYGFAELCTDRLRLRPFCAPLATFTDWPGFSEYAA